MEGRSHLLVGLTGGIVLDSIFHVTGPPLMGAENATRGLIATKAVYYFMVGIGALLPDIDNTLQAIAPSSTASWDYFWGHCWLLVCRNWSSISWPRVDLRLQPVLSSTLTLSL